MKFLKTILSAFKKFIKGYDDTAEDILDDILFVLEHTRMTNSDNEAVIKLCNVIESLINDED